MAKSAAALPVANTSSAGAGFRAYFADYIRAGYQALFIPTNEENRVEGEIIAAAANNVIPPGTIPPQTVYVVAWDLFEGFTALGDASAKSSELQAITAGQLKESYRDPLAAFRMLAEGKVKLPQRCIFVFRDLDDMFQRPDVRRALRSLCEANRLVNNAAWHPVVIVSPSMDIHPKLKPVLTVLDFTLPDEVRLGEIFEFVKSGVTSKDPTKVDCSAVLKDRVVANLLGLTSTEAENTLALCIVRHGGFVEEMLTTIKNEKAQIIKKSEVLNYLPESEAAGRNEIGGFENVIEFVQRRSLAYSRHAREHKMDYPKGIVLLGLPGTGKSMIAMALGKMMEMPVYIMDVGAVFGSLVGESESRMRNALRQIAAQQGCVLLIDEADKAWGGAHQSTGDSGVTQRVFGQLLTWLATKKDRTFVVMTMNRIKNIPSEFLRTGRFDALFYTELPKGPERRQILEIHLRKRGVNPEGLLTQDQWDELISKTDQYVPSELEEMVREGRSLAYERYSDEVKAGTRRADDPDAAKPTFEDFVSAAAQIVPLASQQTDELKAMQDFQNRARPASRAVVHQHTGRSRRVAVDRSGN
jgi:SpoVK/Ycf46/Vps4 family AAA+-type ATPase